MRYILTRALDRRPEGTDVSDVYRAAVLDRLMDEGYIQVVDDTPDEGDVDAFVAGMQKSYERIRSAGMDADEEIADDGDQGE